MTDRLPGKDGRLGSPPRTMNKPKKKLFVPEGALHRKPERDAQQLLRDQVLGMEAEIFDRYVWGESLQAIADTLPFKIQGWKLRSILVTEKQTAERYRMAGIERAHNLVDAAVDYGRQAAAIGDSAGLRVAIDTNLKVAAKLAPREYGDTSKLELTGKNGGALEIKADLSLTAEQAYERLIKGM